MCQWCMGWSIMYTGKRYFFTSVFFSFFSPVSLPLHFCLSFSFSIFLPFFYFSLFFLLFYSLLRLCVREREREKEGDKIHSTTYFRFENMNIHSGTVLTSKSWRVPTLDLWFANISLLSSPPFFFLFFFPSLSSLLPFSFSFLRNGSDMCKQCLTYR